MTEGARATLTLEQVLGAKERRASVQAQMRAEYGSTVVSMTLNMPGPVKYNEDWLGMLYDAAAELRSVFFRQDYEIAEERLLHDPAGATLLIAVKGAADVIKAAAIQLEDIKPWGRLLDLDVFSEAGEQVNRAALNFPPRKCLVCDEVAAICVRASKHDREEVILTALRLAESYTNRERVPLVRDPLAVTIGQIALEAMLMEVAATPAPGLVDCNNSGAHSDMDLVTFIHSSSALAGPMMALAQAGLDHKDPLPELLGKVRSIGIPAEHEMFKATYGINTQKGLLFLLGILSAAAGNALKSMKQNDTESNNSTAELIAQCASVICKGMVERELERLRHIRPERQLTAGEHYYLSHGFTGVRGEIECGLPTVFKSGLPALKDALEQGASENDAMVHALIALMTQTEDTTILHRHNLETLRHVQEEAQALMAAGGFLTPEGKMRVKAMDQRFVEAHISPGGSADLLAVTWFLHRLDELFSADGQPPA